MADPTNPTGWPTSLVDLTNDVKPYLNVDAGNTTMDGVLTTIINAATDIVTDIVGPVVATSYDEWYEGGSPTITVLHHPVLQVERVIEYRGRVAYELTQAPSPDYASTYSYQWEKPGMLTRRTAGGLAVAFPAGVRTVHVEYVAGRATLNGNIKLGALEIIRHLFDTTQQGQRPDYGPDEAMTHIMGYAIPNRVLETLQASRRHPSIA